MRQESGKYYIECSSLLILHCLGSALGRVRAGLDRDVSMCRHYGLHPSLLLILDGAALLLLEGGADTLE